MTRILVLPGIGDIYWVAIALQDLARQHGLTDMELWIWDFDGRRRSLEFVERIPFVKVGGYFTHPPHPHKDPVFHASYQTGTQSIFPGHLGFDFYIAPNGALRHGRTVEEALGAKCDWHFELRQTEGEVAARTRFLETYGPYVLCHFSDFGMFKPWVKAWTPRACAALLTRIHRASGLTMLLTGCEWDRKFSEELAKATPAGVVSIAGETPPDEFFGMLRGATAVLGWCGGNTILATALGKPTLMGWSKVCFPDAGFYRTACPPDAFGKHYVPVVVEATRVLRAEQMFLKLISNYPRVTE